MAGRTPQETDRLMSAAISRGDLEAALELFEPHAVLVDPGSGSRLQGRAQIREAVLGLLDLRPRLGESGPTTVIEAGDLALVLARWAMEATGPDGEPVRESGTATDVMRRQPDGTWRYVIDNPPGTATT